MRYIDADALRTSLIETLEVLRKNPKMDNQEAHLIAGFSMLGKMIDNAKTVDAVSVVRCKDCKWCRLYQLFGTDNYQCERNALSAYFWVEPTDFCSYGERREVQRNFNASNTLDALETEVTE